MGGARNDTATTFAGLFAIAVMGVLMYAVCVLIEQRMTRCAFRAKWWGKAGFWQPPTGMIRSGGSGYG